MPCDAYRSIPILEKLPLQIESMVAFEPEGGRGKLHLIVGTKIGHLLMYEVDLRNPNERVQLLRSNKGFSKKPITQLMAIPECGVLLCLSDNLVTVHDMNIFKFPQIAALEKTKGATLFTIDSRKQMSQTGMISTIVRLCVSVRKTLQLYYWKNREFFVLRDDLVLPEIPKAVSWCGESLFVGIRREYFRITLEGRTYELFPVNGPNEPSILRLDETSVALSHDNKMVILNSEGRPPNASRSMIEWASHPSWMEYDPPFLIAVLPTTLEVRSSAPDVFIQSISLEGAKSGNRPRLLSLAKPGNIFVASYSHIWCLEALTLREQIPLLLEKKLFELALKLNSLRPDLNQEMLSKSIRTLHAFDLFVKQQFKASMDAFYDLDIDPSHVIGLFPDLLPVDFRSQLTYPDDLPMLSGMELENGLLALREYLTQVRYRLLEAEKGNGEEGHEPVKKLISNPIVEGTMTIKSRERLLQIIDTTLVKCFLATTEALVPSFLRLKDNHCHMEETEVALKKHKRYDDLILLYQMKGQHRKALELLCSSQLKNNVSKMVDYLQKIAKDNLDLTLEFSDWILKEEPEEALRLFTEDSSEIEALPRARIMSELEKRAPTLVIPYLKHVIDAWFDTNQLLHDVLADRYLKEILTMISSPETTDSQKLCQLRLDFVDFLEASKNYNAEKILVKLPFDSFFEERAILYGKMEQHEKALAVYIYLLGDISRATQYCHRTYVQEKVASKTVFLTLLRLLLNPPDLTQLGIILSRDGVGTNGSASSLPPIPIVIQGKFPNVPAALTLLEKQATCFKPSEALSLFPDATPLSRFASFLRNNLKAMSVRRKEAQVLKGLHFARHLQVQEQRIAAQSQRIPLTELRVCPACKKKFVNQSAFVRYPGGDLVHYYCQDVYEQSKGISNVAL